MSNRAHRLRISCPRALRGWRFSRHAQVNVDARGFAPHDVVKACEEPELTMTADDYGLGRVRYVRGNVVVIAAPASSHIITVLLRSHDEWDDADARKAAVL